MKNNRKYLYIILGILAIIYTTEIYLLQIWQHEMLSFAFLIAIVVAFVFSYIINHSS